MAKLRTHTFALATRSLENMSVVETALPPKPTLLGASRKGAELLKTPQERVSEQINGKWAHSFPVCIHEVLLYVLIGK